MKTKECVENQQRVILAEEALRGKPGPHYLKGEVIVTDKNLDANAVFPSSDRSIGDRGHVNISHYLFGIWNAAHIYAGLNGLSDTRALKGEWQAFKEGLPDQQMSLHVDMSDAQINTHTARISIHATYSVGEQVYAKFKVSSIARRKK